MVVLVEVDGGDIDHDAWFCEVDTLGGGVDGADYVMREGFEVETPGVAGGELQAVEESGGSARLQLAGGEGVDDDGEGDLNGFAIFEGGELDVLAGKKVSAGGWV